jgi:hypothetical protein
LPFHVNGHSTKIAFGGERIRAADAKEVGVGNPAEETYRYPNQNLLIAHIKDRWSIVNSIAAPTTTRFLPEQLSKARLEGTVRPDALELLHMAFRMLNHSAWY